MYVLWYVVFGLTGLFVASVFGTCVFNHFKKKHYAMRWENDRSGKLWRVLEVLQDICLAIAIITGLIAFVTAFVAIGNPLSADYEVRNYE